MALDPALSHVIIPQHYAQSVCSINASYTQHYLSCDLNDNRDAVADLALEIETQGNNLGHGLGVYLGRLLGTRDDEGAKINPFFTSSSKHLTPFHHESLKKKPSTHVNPNFSLSFLKDFTFNAKKTSGELPGAIYHYQQNLWLIKDTKGSIEQLAKEFVGGAVYRYFLGERASETILLLNGHHDILSDNNKDIFKSPILIGSRIIPGFINLNTLTARSTTVDKISAADLEDPSLLLLSNKKIMHYHNAILASLFAGEDDLHYENMGAVKEDDFYLFTKVDHGHTFERTATKNEMNEKLEDFYHWIGSRDPRDKSYWNNAIYKTIQKMAATPLEPLLSLIDQKFVEMAFYYHEAVKYNSKKSIDLPTFDFEGTKSHYKAHLTQMHATFNDELKDLTLESMPPKNRYS